MALDLRALEDQPGAADETFEAFCRAIVRRQHGACGQFRARRNQPGVEFYLHIDRDCSLGAVGRIYGWSCKWFLLPANNELTQGQRTQIEDSIDKAIRYVPGLTDFVLCLPDRPAKKDLDWFFDMSEDKGVAFALWAPEELESELVGVEVLRRTFLGELVVTAEGLTTARERALAPIRSRWLPGLHTRTHVDGALEEALLRPASFDHILGQAELIDARAERLRGALDGIDEVGLRDRAQAVVDDMKAFATRLAEVPEAARNQRSFELTGLLAERFEPATSPRELRLIIRELRRGRLPAALFASGLPAEIRTALEFVAEAATHAEAPMFAVVGDAGQGKTHLAAKLTAPDGLLPGVLIHGNYLRHGATLDDLARRVQGLGFDRFDDLLEAADAAGARAGCRVPIVIDGLNEAERPLEWQPLLEELVPILSTFPNVVVMVTLRKRLVDQVVPEAATRLELEWDELEVAEIVRTYLAHFLIDPAGAWLPMGLFRNPLFVRMYCESANGDRRVTVGVEALPTSMVGVFELYRDRIIQRLADDPARVHVPADQIKRRLGLFALELWRRNARRLPFDEAKLLIDGSEAPWDESVYRRLEDEGVLFRDEAVGYMDPESGIVFDRFAGYLLADAHLARLRYDELEDIVGADALWERLVGAAAHPLAEDVLAALVDLVPRRFRGQQLWKLAPAVQRGIALARALDLESDLLDDETVDELAALVTGWGPPGRRQHPLDRLWEVHDGSAHRLSARFLDRVLRSLPLPQRDVFWTEWLRARRDSLLNDIGGFIERWEADPARAESDDLSAIALAWVLSSTDLDMRDLATKALQRFGRSAPGRLFEVGALMLDLDDPYISERVVAAAFGAAAAHQMPDPGGPFENALSGWLSFLEDRYLAGGAAPTSHELVRTYIRATFEFAGRLHPSSISAGVIPDALVFGAPPPLTPMADDAVDAEECSRTFGMDFENYVIGSAIEGRRNYDYGHAGFVEAREQVRGRVWALGWRAELFGSIDAAIAEDAGRWHSRTAAVERYGKKYGWIAYYELVGRIDEAGQLRDSWVGGGRAVSGDIDPTFPDEPPPVPLALPEWAQPSPSDDLEWVRSGVVELPAALWSPDALSDVYRPWLFVEGFLEHGTGGRRVFGFFRTLLVEPNRADEVVELVRQREYLGNSFLPELPDRHGIYAGEMPWSDRFALDYDEDDIPPSTALGGGWEDEGVPVELLATSFSAGTDRTSIGLERSYAVPSFEFAQQFDLRQLPGSLDLVELSGARATMTYRAAAPWRGHLLFIDRDLVAAYAGPRRVVRVVWGEREVTVDWNSAPGWLREVHQGHLNLWRHVEVLD